MLFDRLAADGAGLLSATLDGIEDGTITAVPQPAEGVSHAPKLTSDDARVEWAAAAIVVDRLVRACTPAPGAWTTFRGNRVGIGPVTPLSEGPSLGPGEIQDHGHAGVIVGTGTGPLRLGQVKPAGKPAMPAQDWTRGLRLAPGELFE
jgi:methionyl-tRNA formyltransferase